MQLIEMLKNRQGKASFDDWAHEINSVIKPDDKGDRMRMHTLYSYMNGRRNITGKGAKLLAQYFYIKGDLEMVDAISQAVLGIPYPVEMIQTTSLN